MSPGVSAFHFENPDASNIGKDDAGVSFNSGSSTTLIRSKPRFIKRKHLASRNSKSSASFPTADSGLDGLFKLAHESSDKLKDVANGYAGGTSSGNRPGEHEGSRFVFGAGRSSNDLNTNSMNINCKDKKSNFNGTPVENVNNGSECLNSKNVGFVFGNAVPELNPEKEANATVDGEFGNSGDSGFSFSARTSTRASNLAPKVSDSGNDGEKPLTEDHQSSCNLPKGFVFGACERGLSPGKSVGDRKMQETEFKTKIVDQHQRKDSTNMKSDRIPNPDSQSGNNKIHSGGNLGKKDFVGYMGNDFPADMQRAKYETGVGRGKSSGSASYFVRNSAAKISDQVNVDENHGGNSSSSYESVREAKLSDELMKLNINNLDRVGHAREASSTEVQNHVNDASVPKSNRKDAESLPDMSLKPQTEKHKINVGPTDSNIHFGTGKKAYNSSSVGFEYTVLNEIDGSKFGTGFGVFGRKNDDKPQVHSFTGLAPDHASFPSSCIIGGPRQGSSNGQNSHVTGDDKIKLNGNVGTSQFPPSSPSSQSVPATNFIHEDTFKFGSSLATPSDGLGKFKASHCDTIPSFKVDLSNGVDKKLASGVKTRGNMGKKSKNTRRKPLIPNPAEQQTVQETLSGKAVSQEVPESSECSSPMDFSPYQETTVDDDRSKETSARSNMYACIDLNCPPISESDPTSVPSGQRNGDLSTKSDNKHVPATAGIWVGVPSAGSKHGVVSGISGQENSKAQFHPFFNDHEAEKHSFTFGACDIAASHTRRQQKKKYRTKTGRKLGAMSSAQGLSGIAPANNTLGSNGHFSAPENKEKQKSEGDGIEESLAPLAAAEKACEKWRLRGNQAYKEGELSQAEGFYTWGINCIPSCYTSTFCVKPLVLCYSNRAATRMALGRVREGLQDCIAAITVDPDFLKARMRAATCHLMLGELEDAIQIFGKCMESGAGVCLDRQTVIAASERLQKAQKVAEQINQCAELLKHGAADAASVALGMISEAMCISPHSEKLLELKAEALCMLQKHNEVIELCQDTLGLAEKNLTSTTVPDINKVASSDCKFISNVKLWRWRVISRCYFRLGKLEAALNLLEKLESGSKTHESTDPLAVTVRELLKNKNAGNEAFQSARYSEAVEHYTSALLKSFDSRPFAAVCLCNRAAAHQALGQIADAIADCSFAIALDENYAKAVSRRATLHEMIRDYRQATADLQRLVSLLEKQSNENARQSGSGNEKEIRQACRRRSAIEADIKKEVQLDFYLILGIKRSDTAAEIKKAYRKAALRHHPDKVGQTFIRSENGDDGRLWKDIADLVHQDSERLFKMIGEAYAVLSDATKRSEYDHKEDLRNAHKERDVNRSGSSRRQSDYDNYSSPYERSSNRRYWQDSYGYRTYEKSYTRW